jgi:RNA polymerase sigma factor (sigma-70 family)
MEGGQTDGPQDEAGLLERARSGDARAYGELVRRYQEVAFRTAWVLAGTTGEAEDAVQAGFVKAYQALGRFRTGSPFRPWLLTIVANEARNRRRAAGRRAHLELRLRDESATVPVSTEATALEHVQGDVLLAVVNDLAPADRDVIVCRYFLELSETETAAAIGCPRGTVKSRLSRALGRLRAAMGTTTSGATGEGGVR